MKQSGWPRLLFREIAAVPIAVHETRYGAMRLSPDHFKRQRRQSPLLSISPLGNVLKKRYSKRWGKKRLFLPHLSLYLEKKRIFFTPLRINFVHAEAKSLRRYRFCCICLIQGSEKLQEYCLFWEVRENCQKRAIRTNDCIFNVRCRLMVYGMRLTTSQIHQGTCKRISIRILHQN